MQIRVFKDTKKRANEFALYTDANGTRYPQVPRELLEWADVAEQPEDYSDETYYRTEQDDAPYVVYTKKSEEQIAQVMLAKAKAKRQTDIEAIVVTTQAGNRFDGDEVAQGRMSRAALVMTDEDTLPWVMADEFDENGVQTNTSAIVTPVSKAELMEALRLAGMAMAGIWVSVYETA
jgi:hypothetical protein